MSPFDVVSHQEGVSDDARARELYKYYQPSLDINQDACSPRTAPRDIPSAHNDTATPTSNSETVTSNVSSSPQSSPDTALTAFCQLVSWRTGAQRAMISVIDSSTQYFIAESTKTLDLVDNTKHLVGDDLWMGCGSVTKAGRLCERTIAVEPTTNGDYPSFVVNDLSKDERFNQLPFVTGPPYMKLYAGVPLITKRGIPIGSLFIVDSRIWSNGLAQDEINFMGTMANTIMKHLEMSREVEEHRRGMKMSRGLASFVEGRSQLAEADVETEDGEGTRIVGQFETEKPIKRTISRDSGNSTSRSIGASAANIDRREKEYSAALAKAEEALLSGKDSQQPEIREVRPALEAESNPNSFAGSASLTSPPVDRLESIVSPGETISEGSSMKLLFSRASNLIREAFEVDGGAVFYDAQRGFNDLHQKPKGGRSSLHHDSQPTSGDDATSAGETHSEHEDSKASQPVDSPGLGEGLFSRSSQESKKSVEILGFSTAQASSLSGDEYPGPHAFVPFDEKALHTLLSRYPRGKLWTFGSDGAVSSSSEEEPLKNGKRDPAQYAKDLLMRRKRTVRAKSDARFLSRHFPGVRQLLFIPLWDAGRTRWLSGCCVWSTEATRVLSKASELAFLSAFGNSVMAECSRIDTEIADQKKGDFIGSISHELRSPLHGILASAEFLGEEELTGFERGLVETIDSCGRTLLDTINHILDFSKINHFEKNWRKTKRSGNRPTPRTTDSALALRQSDLPMINLFADVDISVVCEEVVESVFAGHVFQNVTAQSFDMVPDVRGKMASSKTLSNEASTNDSEHKQPDVVVILDVDVQNYHFITQPGAFRRVIMNLLGNALKYTSHGYVRVTLEASEIEDLHAPGSVESVPRNMVTLTVTDTGKGISSDFLRSKLFTPFAQENSLSSGTGLGLSIVRSIVNLLEGDITIDSEVGRGTQVRVTLPLLREMPKQPDSSSSITTPRSAASLQRDTEDAIEKLRSLVTGKKVALYGFDINTPDVILKQTSLILKQSVTKFLTKWYGLRVVPIGQKVNFIVANEADPIAIAKLVREGTVNRKPPTILVLCSHSSRFDRKISGTGSAANIGFVAKPVGPLKLARALMQCLDGAQPSTPGYLDPTSAVSESNDLSSVFEELSLSPNSAEILDNSRMAASSDNARKAIESPTPNAVTEKNEEFPFPVPERPQIPISQSMPGDKETLAPIPPLAPELATAIPASLTLSNMEKNRAANSIPTISTISPPKPQLQSPRLLLVDDNKINLTLLRTYMRKRKYDIIDEAENGLEAVNKFNDREEGYDIIFMDISMPVLDGFGATRQIRAIEESRRRKAFDLDGAVDRIIEKPGDVAGLERLTAGIDGRTPALVIALTGLASSSDQNEAFKSGIDLFLTKPVAFKEVGKLLDNWEANRERDARAVTSESDKLSEQTKSPTMSSTSSMDKGNDLVKSQTKTSTSSKIGKPSKVSQLTDAVGSLIGSTLEKNDKGQK